MKNYLKIIGSDISIFPYPIVDEIKFMDFLKFMRIKKDCKLVKSRIYIYNLYLKNGELFLTYDNEDEFIIYLNDKIDNYSKLFDRSKKLSNLEKLKN
jgi:hypothetical protein